MFSIMVNILAIIGALCIVSTIGFVALVFWSERKHKQANAGGFSALKAAHSLDEDAAIARARRALS